LLCFYFKYGPDLKPAAVPGSSDCARNRAAWQASDLLFTQHLEGVAGLSGATR
jgi:hypothetical protein